MLSIGSRGADVTKLQNALKTAGYLDGTPDGVFGAKTKAAVAAFQKANGLTSDGVVGNKTSSALQKYYQDSFDPGTTTTPTKPATTDPGTSASCRAQIERTTNAGRRNQMISGTMTVNGHTYDFRSGGFDKGSLPAGTYKLTEHMHSRNTKGMVVGGVGYSFALSDKYDPRVGQTRSLLRIHPDGGTPGTQGCIGIVGNADVQRRFRSDMEAEIRRNGGSWTLQLG